MDHRAAWAIPVLVIASLVAPMVLTNRALWSDWTNSLWLVDQQRRAVGLHVWPNYFINSDRTGAFSPIFAFFGGTLYWVTTGLAVFVGPTAAYCLMWILGFTLAYGGCTWLSSQLGLKGWRAQVGGLAFVTSAYFLTNLYGRGDFGEFIATSTIPMIVAGGMWLLRAERWKPTPIIAFVVAAVLFSGSHNISLLWGSIFLGIIAILFVRVPLRRLLRLAGLIVVAAGINLWTLLPDVVYARRTQIGNSRVPFTVPHGPWFSDWNIVFSPLRTIPSTSTTPALYVQVPTLLAGWLILAFLMARRRIERPLRNATVGLALITLVFLGLVLLEGIWSSLPEIIRLTQFSYRLTTYVTLSIVGLLICALLAIGEDRRRWLPMLLTVILAYQAGIGSWQAWSSPSMMANRSDALLSLGKTPVTLYDVQSYNDASEPEVTPPPGRILTIDPARVRHGTFRGTVDLPDGPETIATNIASGPYLIRLQGLLTVGRDQSGRLVVRRRVDALTGPVSIAIGTASTWPIVVGRWSTLIALVAIVVILVVVTVAGYRAGRRRPAHRQRDRLRRVGRPRLRHHRRNARRRSSLSMYGRRADTRHVIPTERSALDGTDKTSGLADRNTRSAETER